MKPIMTVYWSGHDVNLSVWRKSDNFFITYEFERISQEKHHKADDEEQKFKGRTVKKILEHLKKYYGIENDFSEIYIKPNAEIPRNHPYFDQIKGPKFYVALDHHMLHAVSAYWQSSFNDCSVIAWDGGGDFGSFAYYEFKDEELVHSESRNTHDFSRAYTDVSARLKTFGRTRRLDLAGKNMGLSAYGEKFKDDPETQKAIDIISKKMCNKVPEQLRMWGTYDMRKILRDNFETTKDARGRECHGDDTELKLSYAAQVAMEDRFIEFVESDFIDRIRKTGNLIITGGSALNVLVNEKVKKTFPDINLFVPSDPHDGGLSAGIMYIAPAWRNRHRGDLHDPIRPKRMTRLYNGPVLSDLDRLPDYNPTAIVTIKEIASMLREGKIIGLLQGGSEIGPRALGNRSILCDPSYPNMKDDLNAKVKFREWFRPFAPVCTLETADQYFESNVPFEDMNAMQYAPTVKKEYQEKLLSVTHVDGTARLQTVAEKDNPVLHSLLTEFDGVLLNTSFNVQGKPITNYIQDALGMLERTGLDAVIVRGKDKKLWLFE